MHKLECKYLSSMGPLFNSPLLQGRKRKHPGEQLSVTKHNRIRNTKMELDQIFSPPGQEGLGVVD